MVEGFLNITNSKNGNVSYYVRDGETEMLYSNISNITEEVIQEFRNIEYLDTKGNKELGIRAIKNANVRTNIMLTLPNDMDNEKCMQHLKNIINKTPIKDCSFLISIHKGEGGEVEKNKHVHIVYNERNLSTMKKDRRFKEPDYLQKFLVNYKTEFGFGLKENEFKRQRIETDLWKSDPDMARKIVQDFKTQQEEKITPAEAHHQDKSLKLVIDTSNPAPATETKAWTPPKPMTELEALQLDWEIKMHVQNLYNYNNKFAKLAKVDYNLYNETPKYQQAQAFYENTFNRLRLDNINIPGLQQILNIITSLLRKIETLEDKKFSYYSPSEKKISMIGKKLDFPKVAAINLVTLYAKNQDNYDKGKLKHIPLMDFIKETTGVNFKEYIDDNIVIKPIELTPIEIERIIQYGDTALGFVGHGSITNLSNEEKDLYYFALDKKLGVDNPLPNQEKYEQAKSKMQNPYKPSEQDKENLYSGFLNGNPMDLKGKNELENIKIDLPNNTKKEVTDILPSWGMGGM